MKNKKQGTIVESGPGAVPRYRGAILLATLAPEAVILVVCQPSMNDLWAT
jgi:hypothetical protein